jgi:hydrogenase nickel incorporation protein HypA/HybF
MAIAQSIAEQVQAIAEREGPVRVTGVRVRVGAMRAVVPEVLEMGLEVLSRGTAIEGARLVVEEVPVRVSCGLCGTLSSPEAGWSWLCPACGSADVEMVSGGELVLQSLEGEG